MRCLLLILTALLCFAIESRGSLSLHSDNLVQMFTDYLANMEQRQMDRFIHSRKRAVGDDKPEYLRICTGRKDCGSVVQNFGFMYDHDSGMELCNKSYVTKADGITCFDKYPSCRYLRDEFSICEKQEVADRLGCDLTCGKCQPATPYEKKEEPIILY